MRDSLHADDGDANVLVHSYPPYDFGFMCIIAQICSDVLIIQQNQGNFTRYFSVCVKILVKFAKSLFYFCVLWYDRNRKTTKKREPER